MEEQLDKSNIKQFLQKHGSCITDDRIRQSIQFLSEYDYRVTSLLGAGAFGVVMKALDKNNKRDVAIKLIIINETEQVISANSEAQKAKLIKSEYVIKCFDQLYDDDNCNFFIISEYIQNGDLHFFAQNNQLSKDQITSFFYQILNGLQAIHSKNIIHGDLKPQNILISQNNSIKIGDLGLSQTLKPNKSHVSNNVGTIAYSSKEQMEGRIRKESDLFSAGCVICFLCKIPIESDMMTMINLKSNVFPPSDNPSLKDILQLAYKLMRQDPQERISINQALQDISLLNKSIDQNTLTNPQKTQNIITNTISTNIISDFNNNNNKTQNFVFQNNNIQTSSQTNVKSQPIQTSLPGQMNMISQQQYNISAKTNSTNEFIIPEGINKQLPKLKESLANFRKHDQQKYFLHNFSYQKAYLNSTFHNAKQCIQHHRIQMNASIIDKIMNFPIEINKCFLVSNSEQPVTQKLITYLCELDFFAFLNHSLISMNEELLSILKEIYLILMVSLYKYDDSQQTEIKSQQSQLNLYKFIFLPNNTTDRLQLNTTIVFPSFQQYFSDKQIAQKEVNAENYCNVLLIFAYKSDQSEFAFRPKSLTGLQPIQKAYMTYPFSNYKIDKIDKDVTPGYLTIYISYKN